MSPEKLLPESSTDSVLGMVGSLREAVRGAIDEISDINRRTRMLALNAQIEAARAGQHGAAFGVVASELQNLSLGTERAASEMVRETGKTIDQLSHTIGSTIRGTRLGDLSLVNIDLIDRNLYERTCDVRWWATDPSLVTALRPGDRSRADAVRNAAERLATILRSYTVYFDLVLCDDAGNIVANAKPGLFKSVGQNVRDQAWFRDSMQSQSSDDYAFRSAHHCQLVNGEAALVYAAAVRGDDRSHAPAVGVLGILFDWLSLARTIVQRTPIADAERKQTRCLIVDNEGFILASDGDDSMTDQVEPKVLDLILHSDAPQGFVEMDIRDRPCCVAFAAAPGYETYCTGWHSVIIQTLTATR